MSDHTVPNQTEGSWEDPSYTDDVIAVMRSTIEAQRRALACKNEIIDTLREQLLLAKPLRLRFDAENAVLAAMADATIKPHDGGPMMTLEDEWRVCRAELERREAGQ